MGTHTKEWNVLGSRLGPPLHGNTRNNSDLSSDPTANRTRSWKAGRQGFGSIVLDLNYHEGKCRDCPRKLSLFAFQLVQVSNLESHINKNLSL